MQFGQYQTTEILKQSGPVIVARATAPGRSDPVILKLLQRTAVTPDRVAAMQREYRLIQALQSPRLVRAIELAWEDDCPALIMHNQAGQTLAQVLAAGQPSMATALRIGIAIARALQDVHDAGILHGDVSPDNIIVGASPDAVALIDFGLAHLGGLPPRERLGLRGTVDYVAPEMTGRLLQSADQRADLYSLGVLLFQMLAGELPFAPGDVLQKVYAHLAVQPRPLKSLVSTAPDVLAEVVSRLMAKQPERRYQTAAGVVADLSYCLSLTQGEPSREDFVPGQWDVPRQLNVSATMQGREPALNQLRDVFDRIASRKQDATTVEVQGEPGVGKSTLVTALQPHVERDGGLFLRCNLDVGPADRMSRLVQAARSLAEMLLTERYGTLAGWQERLKTGMGDLAAALAALGPELAALVGETAATARLGARENAERLGLALRQFFRLAASAGQPLVLLVEDIQVADGATLAVLDGLVRKEGADQLLLLLTQRIEPGRPVVPISADLQIRLEVLDAEAIAAILSETFRQQQDRVLPLARIILDKVGGAPLATGQFLGALADEGLIRLDQAAREWTWDSRAIEARDVGESVVELLLARGERLSPADRATIGAAAQVGRSFLLTEAEIAAGEDSEAISGGLERAIAMGWLAPALTDGPVPALRFTHERIWQAADSLVSPNQKRAAHRRLAEALMQSAGGWPTGEALSRTADHMAAALEPEASAEARAQTRGLNAAAGGAALEAGDLQSGYRHLRRAAGLLNADLWSHDPRQCLEITAHAAAAAMLVGQFDEAQAGFVTFLSNCPDPVGRAGVHALRVFANVGQNQAQAAIMAGLEGLAELGDPLPENPGPDEIGAEVGGIFAALAGRQLEDLARLPDAPDPAQVAVQQILAAVLYPSFSANPLMFAATAARLAARSIQDGLTEHSVVGFNDFGLVACGPMNQVGLGYGFSQLAQALVATRNLAGLQGRILTIFNAFIRHRKEPIRATLPGLRAARDAALATGDVNMAALAAFDHAFQVFWIGEQLELAEVAFAEADDFCRDLKVGIMPDLIRLYRQLIAGLRARPARPDALEGAYASGAALQALYQKRRDANGLAQLHLAQMLLAHVYGDRDAALAQARLAAPLLDGITSTPAVPAYHALFAMLAVPAGNDQATDPADLEQLRRSAAVTAYWATEAPQNYLHHDLVVQAELALADGDEPVWLERMEKAVDHATAQKFTRDAALILERIAEVGRLRHRQRRSAHFLRDAWRAWVHYGAEPKVADLSARYGADLERPMAEDGIEGTGSSLSLRDDQLDLGALLKATRAISQELTVQDLLRVMIVGLVETAGASSAVIVAPQGSEFRVVAELVAGREGPEFLTEPDMAAARICGPETAPLSVLRLVAHLRRTLTTRDVKADARLAGDVYFKDRAPKSLAIIPLMKGSHVLGMVCLGNQDVTDAFSDVRLNILNALCAQAAISWDNALLFESQKKLLAAADRFVPAELSRLFNRESIVDVHATDAQASRMTIVVSDLRGSTSSAEGMGPRQTFAMINGYFASFSRAVRENGGFVLKYVGDGVLALFPDGPAPALKAALAYQQRLDAEPWDDRDGARPRAGIAIHSGDVMFGVVGSSDRMQIDAISDAVNVTFRLEALTKRFGARVLVSDDALADLAGDAGLLTRYLGETETRGRKGRIRIFELIDAESPDVRQAKLATLQQFSDGLRHFEQADWVNACVNLSSVLRDNPGDTAASGLFQQAARRMAEQPK